MGTSFQYQWELFLSQISNKSLLSNPIELYGIIVILIALVIVSLLTRVCLKSYKENQNIATLYFALAFVFLIAAAVFLFVEQLGYSSLGKPDIGDIGGIIATIAVGTSMVFIDLFAFQNTFPDKVKLFGIIVAIGSIIYVGTIDWAILTGWPVKDIVNFEIVYYETWINVLIYCTVPPIVLIAPITFYYFAYKAQNENAPSASRSRFFGTGLLIFAIGYIAELAPFFPTVLSNLLRTTYLIAGIMLYIAFTMPDWYKKRIGWT